MPRILLLGPSVATMERLANSPFSITVAKHSNVYYRNLPSPTDWDLIVHVNCSRSKDVVVAPADFEITSSYLEEALAPEIVIPSRERCGNVSLGRVSGHLLYETLGSSDAFVNCIDLFDELADSFQTDLYLTREPNNEGFMFDEVVAKNQYDDAVLTLDIMTDTETGRQKPLLSIIPARNNEAEAEILDHLIHRTLPKIFPRAYWDLFIPERVHQIDKARDELIASRIAQVREFDKEKRRELDYYAPFTLLARQRDDALKDIVAVALREFGFDVTDLDSEVKDRKDADLLAMADGKTGYVETKSSGNRNCSSRELENFAKTLALPKDGTGWRIFGWWSTTGRSMFRTRHVHQPTANSKLRMALKRLCVSRQDESFLVVSRQSVQDVQSISRSGRLLRPPGFFSCPSE